ncbi:phage baseplate protein [Pantoea stewartii]|uniref:Putative bacteriophage protein n=1 Tax=Pantoea stewartii subsp. stewartii DC283 TaxID=660596 RepID=H3RHX8_PANSE|nr:hypothetical protein [Pantoea stewartii]ARF48192.1 hypothetical protein DSJ_01525 [Pantoea stewartii subsp. stewartii DC283]ARF49654.1 hypothetical protein DSJ_10085 [Pantoea stewartii subsp. stewartii DC283]EHT99073.1 putative bacteriophage protein [Pantoea stewartii subsp. stewartii DC283]EHU01351.1 putative bacteriophage protein [Pantoea stewartii subsp. stewartii DC283]KAB0545263.1 hypothetical protein F7Q90_25525 [Pantoea stewartii subsp. stewartii]
MDILSVLLNRHSRSIGTVIPDVTISEKHYDRLEITEHPVERPTSAGTGFVADHAYRQPSEVIMQIGFAGGGSVLDVVNTAAIGISAGKSPKEIYADLLEIQRNRELLDVVTGKRIYKNMLIKSLEVTTDKVTENVLMATVTLREVIISSTHTIQVADKANMTQGQNTAPVKDMGTKTGVPVANESVLSSLFNSITGKKAG